MSKAWLNAAQAGDFHTLKLAHATLQFLDVNCTTRIGQSAAMLAASQGHVHVVAWLAGQGADLARLDQFNQSALSLALRRGHRECAECILHSGGGLHFSALKELGRPAQVLFTQVSAPRRWRRGHRLLILRLHLRTNLI